MLTMKETAISSSLQQYQLGQLTGKLNAIQTDKEDTVV